MARAFAAALGAKHRGAAPEVTIDKAAAERALRTLTQADTSPAEQAQVVQRYLDGSDAAALSVDARDALRAFVVRQGAPDAGAPVLKVRAEARGGGEHAQAKVVSLLARRSTPAERQARQVEVSSWLDAADAELVQAGARLAQLALPDAPGAQKLRPTRVEALRRAFARLDRAGTLSWTPGGVLEHHLGERFAKVELWRERRPDGFTFTAYLPLGALAPNAPGRDPNHVGELYVERSGGVAGLTYEVGPLRLRHG